MAQHPDADAILAWYAAVRRDLPWRRTTDPYRILVSEVMLQQTQVVRVVPYYEAWLERFPGDQMLVLPSETLYRDPAGTYARVLRFLDLPAHDLGTYRVFNDRKSAPMDPAIRAELTEYFRPYNAALAARLCMRFEWAGADG